MSEKKNPPTEYRETLCVYCKRSTPGPLECSWARDFRPVEGWKAKERVYKNNNGAVLNSYQVDECPQFIPDRMCGGCVYGRVCKRPQRKKGEAHKCPHFQRKVKRDPETISDEGVIALMEAAVKAAAKDYKIKKFRKGIERWIRSSAMWLSDPDTVIELMKKSVEE